MGSGKASTSSLALEAGQYICSSEKVKIVSEVK